MYVDLDKFDANNGGAHLNYIEMLVERNKKHQDQQFFISSKPTIADIQIFDICDLVSCNFSIYFFQTTSQKQKT